MLTYTELQSNRRKLLALTGLTLPEFQRLLPAFTRSYEELFSTERTLAGRPRQRFPGGGRKGVLHRPEQKLLFILVYLKAYPLQVLLGELFELSQQGANFWIHRLLPVLRRALDALGVLPERNPGQFGSRPLAAEEPPRLIIDATERRRQRPKNPEKQAAHYSGKKKTHTDKNVVIVQAQSKRISFLSRTYVGRTHEKKIVDQEKRFVSPRDDLVQGYRLSRVRTSRPANLPGEKKSRPEAPSRRLRSERTESWHRSGSKWSMPSPG